MMVIMYEIKQNVIIFTEELMKAGVSIEEKKVRTSSPSEFGSTYD